MTQAQSEEKNENHSWKIQHVIILRQSMDFNSPHIWIVFSKGKAQIFCKAPCYSSI